MLKRTRYGGELREAEIGSTVILNGWVNTYRDQGKGLFFLDLRAVSYTHLTLPTKRIV